MSKVLVILFAGVVKVLSLLPLSLLYLFSDVAFVLVYYLVGYRKKVVYSNISRAFPDKKSQDKRTIVKAFYRHLCDVVFEVIKMYSISKKELCQRVVFKNIEVLHALRREKISCVVITGHYGNWEWLNSALPDEVDYARLGVYRPLHNKHFDNFVLRLRSRLGTELVTMKRIYRKMLAYSKDSVCFASGFISDQCPSWEEIHYWVDFMHQDTPVYTGQERLARKLGLGVVFFAMRKIDRGYYEVEIIPITENASQTAEFEITNHHVHLLEGLIKEDPACWLWTHKRWKRTREEWHKKFTIVE